MKHAKNAQVWVIGSMVIKSVSYASVAHLKYKSRDTVILDERMIFDVSAFWAIPLVWTESLCPTVCCVCTKLCIIEVASKRERERESFSAIAYSIADSICSAYSSVSVQCVPTAWICNYT